ncbi:MAG: glycoside hydrolase family 2 protein [Bacteroidales bacterium]|nr:glycoside hydrolase family 2 protein [Bacteroidales bacterium]
MKKIEFVCIALIIVSATLVHSCDKMNPHDVKTIINLNKDWNFQMKGDTSWLPAEVPGCVHTDLIYNKKINDPFYRNNEKDLQWIDKEDWIYSCNFILDHNQINKKQIYLLFEGLDTYAKVFLNDQLILETDNMFRTWRKDVKEYVVEGKNHLRIEFCSAIDIGLEKLNKLGYGLPAVNDQSEIGGLENKKVSVFTRKAPYHFGWDWGPRFVTSGIWRPVKLILTNHSEIQTVHFKQVYVSKEEANVDALVVIHATKPGRYKIDIESGNNRSFMTSSFSFEEGIHEVMLPFLIKDPELWWPNGMGKQYLYTFKTILSKNDTIIDTLSNKIGLREIELVREPDSLGKSFYFRVNGKNVFAKGANYIPNDNFLSRVTKDKYENIIGSAAEANMNMIRVWGGGIYENDIFYDLCDKYGLMIWQDFVFACSMYPGDDDFLENVRQEAIDNVKRLRNHASLALWCGNNEIDAAWCEGVPNCGWHWKEKYSEKQRKEIWHSYDTLFHKILPKVVELYDGILAYWPSSPQADWGVHASYESTSGDQHFWGVWHGKLPFSAFYDHVGRFMSEYGFQSFPSMTSIKKFTKPEDRDIESDVMLSHQRSGKGNALIVKYMEDLYPVPEEFNKLLYLGQVLQAEGIKQAIHAHRAHKPYCMGTLYWQLNDCWPAASWSSIDYYLSWKALHYYVKKAFQPVIIAFIPDNKNVIISVSNDNYEKEAVILSYRIRNFKGEILEENAVESELAPEKSIIAATIAKKSIADHFNLRDIFLEARLLKNDKVIAQELYFFEVPKNLNLPESNIDCTVHKKGETIHVELKSNQLVRNLFLYYENEDIHFSDNYFNLLPGEKVIVSCFVNKDTELDVNKLKMISLNDILNP